MKKIGMVVAMQKEIVPLFESLGIKVKTVKRFGFDITKFDYLDKSIICMQSGIGEIHAAAATQALIGTYGAEAIINFGVCGALGETALTETVIVKGVAHYDFDLSPIDDVSVGQYPSENSAVIETDKFLRKTAKKILPDCKEVICASADKFVADEKEKERLKMTFGAEICEMESAGVLITCKHSGVPCLIVKAVSDGKGGAEEYKKTVDTASRSCVRLVTELLKKL